MRLLMDPSHRCFLDKRPPLAGCVFVGRLRVFLVLRALLTVLRRLMCSAAAPIPSYLEHTWDHVNQNRISAPSTAETFLRHKRQMLMLCTILDGDLAMLFSNEPSCMHPAVMLNHPLTPACSVSKVIRGQWPNEEDKQC